MAATRENELAWLHNSNACPFCGSQNISPDPLHEHNNAVHRDWGCNSCENEWTAKYTLTGID